MNYPEKQLKDSSVLDSGEDLTLKQLFDWCLSNILTISVITGLFSIASIIYSLTATEIYTAEIKVIAAVEEQGNFGAAQGIAQLAGLNLESEVSKYSEYMTIVQSHAFLTGFLKKHGLKDKMFASLSDWKAVEKFLSNNFSESKNLRTGITTLSLSWTDPAEASIWLNSLIKEVNSSILERDLIDLKARVQNIENKIKDTSDKTQRNLLFSILSQQLNNINLAESKKDYAIKILDPSFPPESRSSPRRTRIVIFWTFIGFAMSILITFLINQFRPQGS